MRDIKANKTRILARVSLKFSGTRRSSRICFDKRTAPFASLFSGGAAGSSGQTGAAACVLGEPSVA